MQEKTSSIVVLRYDQDLSDMVREVKILCPLLVPVHIEHCLICTMQTHTHTHLTVGLDAPKKVLHTPICSK